MLRFVYFSVTVLSIGMTRSLQFRIPIEAPIGPKSSQVDVCLKKRGHGVHVVESSTRLVDIPYGDYFSVEDRWTVVPHTSDPDSCTLFIELKVVFGKSTFWKKAIEARAVSDNRAKWEKWVTLAKKFLCSKNRNDGVNHPAGGQSKSMTSLENPVPHEIVRKDRGSVISRQSRSKPSHRQGNSSATFKSSGRAGTTIMKVFPWILAFILLLVIFRLQITLSRIERSLSENNELIVKIEKQHAGPKRGACLAESIEQT
ncbi:hypothetical protein PsorP6_003412 [Peronosclerospora sorghi]|uniref:Uncharacterized protein n=1 Tax=Peronosclerospora sorghi TaxID=230839 RepID=A0ACC0VQI8_9STRA|nr:hypothetical protein PsorP6_003412 [Peronosclerospora sorghi]